MKMKFFSPERPRQSKTFKRRVRVMMLEEALAQLVLCSDYKSIDHAKRVIRQIVTERLKRQYEKIA